MTADETVKKAAGLATIGELDDAFELLEPVLIKHPDHAKALLCATFIFDRANKLHEAYVYALRTVAVDPSNPYVWVNMGRAYDRLYMLDEAVEAYKKGAKLAVSADSRALLLRNVSGLYISRAEFDKAEAAALKSLELEPGHGKTIGNYGMACLGQHKWVEGWKNYGEFLLENRKKHRNFHEEPLWDGTPGKTVLVQGEQGLGDEVIFASMFREAAARCKKLIIECEPRLKRLFLRSFGDVAEVHGTRYTARDWDDSGIEASCVSGQLGGIFRLTDESFHGEKYLTCDEDRRLMWRALFEKKKKPVIGLAWTGGVQHTAATLRAMSLDMLLPLFEAVDAHWVTLQYKGCQPEVDAFVAKNTWVDIKQYAFGTLTNDYEDTAALVSECDLVISMQTAAVHLAAGLGVKTWCMLPLEVQWRYSTPDKPYVWSKYVSLFRQERSREWEPVISTIAERLKEHFKLRAVA